MYFARIAAIPPFSFSCRITRFTCSRSSELPLRIAIAYSSTVSGSGRINRFLVPVCENLRRFAVDHDHVDLAGIQRGDRQRAVREAFRLLDVLRHIGVAGGAVLHADALAFQVVPALDRGISRHDDHLPRLHVRHGKIDLPLAVLGHGDAGSGHVGLAGLHRRNHRVETHILDDQLLADFAGDFGHDIDVDADDPVAFAEFVGRKRRLRDHHEFIVGTAAGAEHRSQHRRRAQSFQKTSELHSFILCYFPVKVIL